MLRLSEELCDEVGDCDVVPVRDGVAELEVVNDWLREAVLDAVCVTDDVIDALGVSVALRVSVDVTLGLTDGVTDCVGVLEIEGVSVLDAVED